MPRKLIKLGIEIETLTFRKLVQFLFSKLDMKATENKAKLPHMPFLLRHKNGFSKRYPVQQAFFYSLSMA